MSFYEDVLKKDHRFTSIQAVKDLDMLEPVTRAAVEAIIAEAATMGIHLAVTETYRSLERQAHLFTTGATKLKAVGVHHYGLACDFMKLEGTHASWAGDWTFLGRLAAKHGMIWGGDWGKPDVKHSFVDSDHVQRCTLTEQTPLFAGKWYPDGVVNA